MNLLPGTRTFRGIGTCLVLHAPPKINRTLARAKKVVRVIVILGWVLLIPSMAFTLYAT
ncbi:MAG: hypothetical protein AOA65_2144 [Candidatus Bathyarchaeota archaeon BA1]|nr:MAG: hypothetical protein AOA65_2144 [Candidatus Bathyarchaeota archaeon BA1]